MEILSTPGRAGPTDPPFLATLDRISPELTTDTLVRRRTRSPD
jgi:hypothetical protein